MGTTNPVPRCHIHVFLNTARLTVCSNPFWKKVFPNIQPKPDFHSHIPGQQQRAGGRGVDVSRCLQIQGVIFFWRGLPGTRRSHAGHNVGTPVLRFCSRMVNTPPLSGGNPTVRFWKECNGPFQLLESRSPGWLVPHLCQVTGWPVWLEERSASLCLLARISSCFLCQLPAMELKQRS